MEAAGSTFAALNVHIRPAESRSNNGLLSTKLPRGLEKLIFNIDSILRIKTFYSLSPFASIPGQSMLTARGSVRFRDEFFKFKRTLHTRPFERRQHQLAAQQSSCPRTGETPVPGPPGNSQARQAFTELPTGWAAKILVPIQPPAGLLPTFCSPVVARHYSIITHVKLGNAHVKPVVLEVPVQIIYSPPRRVDTTAAGPEYVLCSLFYNSL
jgi:hypothetical protein